jgi:preprotein translocase subunit SecB
MSDPTGVSPPDGAPGFGVPGAPPQIRILAQFTRDLSFENPHAPDSLRMTDGQPSIDLGVEMNARGRPDGLYEVDLKLTGRATREGTTVFQVELLYGGLFELVGFAEDQLELVLLIECPRFLFPFARRIISDLTAEGGFPPFNLDPIDFAAVYAARNQAGLLQPPVGNA